MSGHAASIDEFGNLPSGVHRCSVDELAARFGSGSEERETEITELLQFIEVAKQAGIRRLMVNGSFVTSKSAPIDVDVVILPGQQTQGSEVGKLAWPFLQIVLAQNDADFEEWGQVDFATDGTGRPKGVVEVMP